MTDRTYTILKNDCLSLLAKRFNVSVDELIKLNSQQIKDPNLIYEGDVLKLPEDLIQPIDFDGSRIDLVEPPTRPNCGNDTCQSPMKYHDILYVPAHPKTGKKAWYALTEQAKEKIAIERANMAQAIVENDAEATMKNLNKLGLISKFAAKVHEQFMTPEEVEKYKALLLANLVIKNEAFRVDGRNPNDFLLDVALLIDVPLEETRKKLSDREQAKNRHLYYGKFGSLYRPSPEGPVFEKQINHQLRALIIDKIKEEIERLEKAAENAAKGHVADDGSKFIYDKQLKYFTSTHQNALALLIRQMHSSRGKSEQNLLSMGVKRSRAYLVSWPTQLQQALEQGSRMMMLSVQEQQNFVANQKAFVCAISLKSLNHYGLVIKEQCLTLNQLEGESGIACGPAALKKIRNWRESGKALDIINDSQLIENLYAETAGDQFDNDLLDVNLNRIITGPAAWSYFTATALKAVIDATINKHKNALSQVLGSGASTPIDELFRQLLWVKKLAIARLEYLKSLAQKRAAQGAGSLEFTLGNESEMPPTLTLLWDETKYKPKEKQKSGFINKAEANDLQAVECCLLSDKEVFYIRGPHWLIPENNEDREAAIAAGHVRVITERITFSATKSTGKNIVEAGSLTDALDALSKPENKLDLMPIKASAEFDTVFWQDSYHYQGGKGPNGETSAYSVDAGAQLLRLSTKAEADLNSPVSSYQNLIKKRRNIGGSGSISAQFTALQGQLSFAFWLPFIPENKAMKPEQVEQVKGYDISLTYVDKHSREHKYEAGDLRVCIAGSVYGLAAASCQLSAKVAIGPSDVSDGFGIKGSTIGLLDPNIYDAYTFGGGNLRSAGQAGYAGEAAISVDAFAGVEAGGTLGAAVYWAPPEVKCVTQSKPPKPPKKLGSIDGKLSGSFGAGYHAEFRLLIQGGVIILVASAGLVVGPGCTGKVAINLDANAADEFIGCLLGVLKQSHFRRLAIFGEADADGINDSFNELNSLMTLAFGLGLGLAQVLLMPATALTDYKQQVLSQEYAPLLAGRVLDSEKQTVTQRWVVALPPETLSNLFLSLIQKQTSSRRDSNGLVIATAEQGNERQVQAIVQIMQWLSADKSVGEEANQRQWKETLIAMGKLPAGKKDHQVEWQTYQAQWLRLARFVKASDFSKDQKISNDFDEASKTLCKNMVLTRYDESFQSGLLAGIPKPTQYFAYPIGLVQNPVVGQKVQIWLETESHCELVKKNEIIISWSIHEALS
ncbi:LysM peptidoglycan-binding domain-containing protein [Vibrio fluvialis]|uniref:LysM peptidoglycan-binding domain-containing protein n=1 Tax=Vibrio fluvialis TaxID=676 RepID=UPI001BAEAD95|nr:LysM domain-containing protein [Vibrio fluvialis]EKO3497878.1 LysM peptidoglycan-binding domain-containing protein [Vibrio fluvialis]EKO3967638.1 LysM domain-containing protein [Vibrio fluvialis]EKZ8998926.1 LysM peptidoglycan-binding domain-containing protein [Vibrio fluvialis]ELI1827656.1 LysM peptidoglycan-binding domain-containing protein [Vibrio fluvialis]QUF70772.1 LysM peptidoglycan-binding domain-containing protein [Vibrio fluvialis]